MLTRIKNNLWSGRFLKRALLATACVAAFGLTTAGTASEAEARGCRGYRGGYGAFYGGGFGPGFYQPGFRGGFGPAYYSGYRGGFGPGFYYGPRRGVTFAVGF